MPVTILLEIHDSLLVFLRNLNQFWMNMKFPEAVASTQAKKRVFPSTTEDLPPNQCLARPL